MEKENIEDFEKGIKDLLSGKPIKFKLELTKPSRIQVIQKKTIKEYSIKPLNLDDTFKISVLLDECKEAFVDLENTTVIDREGITAKHMFKFKEIIAIFLDETVEFVGKQIDTNDATKLIYKILETKQSAFFLNTFNSLSQNMTIRDKEQDA